MVKVRFIFFGCGLLLLLGACSTKHYRRSADKEVAKIIAHKTKLVPNMDTNFTIEATNEISLAELPVFSQAEEFFGREAEMERGAQIISLEKALELAVKHNRTYQNRKEVLYLNALRLTLERHRYTPIFSSGGQVDYKVVETGVSQIVEERSISASETTRLSQLLRFGTKIGISFTSDFLRFIAGGSGVSSSSQLSATLSQPLLEGAGYKIASENLTQAERNLLYALRDFTRYRKEFSVQMAAEYYSVLQNRDAVRNSWLGLQSFQLNAQREKAFAEEGQRSQAALDQIKQAALQTESRWINAVRSYRRSLDEFKIQLGLPTDARVMLADQELLRLQIIHPQIQLEEAMQVAMVSRLDLETQRDELADAQRHIKVARNGFLPGLDVVGQATAPGRTGGGGFTSPDWQHYHWSAGLALDLPLDRKAQRNTYRSTLIDFERAKRELALAVDNIKLQISDGWRSLDQARRNYEISELGVEIAARRVEEQRLRQELGRGTARDLIDAQNDLIDSKNQRTSALVSHTIARLRFWRDMGILFIKDNGQWEEKPLKDQ